MSARSVVVIGRGKVGTTLARGWRTAGWQVKTVAGRREHAPALTADLVVVAVRDGAVAGWSERLAAKAGGIGAAVHVAGALGLDALEPLRQAGVRIGRMHPMVGFASPRAGALLDGAAMVIEGGASAVAAQAARALGMKPIVVEKIEPALYHAAAALVGNGTVALVAGAVDMLEAVGLTREDATFALGGLLLSVALNVSELGLPHALTGPIRRGDAVTVRRHLEVIAEAAPDLLPLFRELAKRQIALARAIGDEPVAAYRALEVAIGARRPESV